MGTPRVQHSALPPPAPSRCGAESLRHRVAVAPSASSIAGARARSTPGTVAADAATRGRRPGPPGPPPQPPAERQRLAALRTRPLRQLRCRYALSGSAARRTPRATARLATSCAGGPSGHGAATRLSPAGARAKSNPGTVAAGAATWARRPSPRPNRNKPPSHHPAPRPQQQLAAPHTRPLRRLRCRYALSGSARTAHTTRHRAPRHLVRRRPFGPRVRNPIVSQRRVVQALQGSSGLGPRAPAGGAAHGVPRGAPLGGVWGGAP